MIWQFAGSKVHIFFKNVFLKKRYPTIPGRSGRPRNQRLFFYVFEVKEKTLCGRLWRVYFLFLKYFQIPPVTVLKYLHLPSVQSYLN